MKFLILVGLLACMVAAEDDEETMALKYLNQFHYISPSRSGNHNVKKAIENMQAFAGLPVTGELDPETIAQMKMPRCGDADVDDNGLRIRRYKLGSKWSKKHLTYHISHGRDLPQGTQDAVFAKALKYWADVSGLSFSRTMNGPSADIKISFGGRTHGGPHDRQGTCSSRFDGPGKVLAHAYFPSNGRAHFDEDETYTDGTTRGTNLLWVATHEFGHSLGLSHSDVRNAVMYPYYTGYKPGFGLQQDDINGIRAHYGSAGGGGGGGGGGSCVDKNGNCRYWKRYCSSNAYVKQNCKKTCGTC